MSCTLVYDWRKRTCSGSIIWKQKLFNSEHVEFVYNFKLRCKTNLSMNLLKTLNAKRKCPLLKKSTQSIRKKTECMLETDLVLIRFDVVLTQIE